jgi:hypothetical protein
VIRELSDSEFHATFSEPMRRMEVGESFRPIPLRDYVLECVSYHQLPTSLDAIQLENEYLAGDQQHTHILLNYGVPNLYLVIVVAHSTDSVLGHHFLNLSEKYGLIPTPGNAI